MPAVHCPRCQRANPADAVYCHFDGIVLRQHGIAGQPGMALPGQAFVREFVFPSGRRCRNFDDFVQGCQYEWEDAREQLRQGQFARFLASVGRHDLVKATQEAQAQSDPDMGLYQFLNSLPGGNSQGPRLDLNPRRLNLGVLRAGEMRQVRLTVLNQGRGLLQGKISVTEGGKWLKVGDGPIDDRCPVKAGRDQQVTLRIDTRGLPAPQGYNGKLTVITNGGIAEVPVGLHVAAIPFPRPPYTGAGSPRELAERMRAQPKPAVPLLESGEVARWFTLNGWAYPVQGPTAKGLAAVQQFFEGMGLSKPPPLTLSETQQRFSCVPPEVARGQVTLRTTAKKWVYAHIESDVPWLRVITPAVGGAQQAEIAYEVDSTLVDPGTHEGILQITANAEQKLALRVRLEVYPPQEPFTRRLLKPFLAGMLLGLLYRLLILVPGDLAGRLLFASPSEVAPAGTLAAWLRPAIYFENYWHLEYVKAFVLLTWWLGAMVGAVLLWQRGSRLGDVLGGAVAGAMAGLAGSATLACLLPFVDMVPRLVLLGMSKIAGANPESKAWTPVWLILALAWWTILGGVVGLALSLAGRLGRRVLNGLAWPVAGLLRGVGMKGLAGLFTFQ